MSQVDGAIAPSGSRASQARSASVVRRDAEHLAPSAASAEAAARPRPRLAPVTIADAPFELEVHQDSSPPRLRRRHSSTSARAMPSRRTCEPPS